MPVASVHYTFTQARDELILRMGNRTDITSRATRWLDSAQVLIARSLLDMPDLTMIVNNVHFASNEVSLIATIPELVDMIGIISVRDDTNDRKLIRFPWWEYRSLHTVPTSPPSRWARQGYQFALDAYEDPIDLTFEYRRQPARAVCEIDNVYQEAWITAAEWIGWKALQRHNDAAAAFKLLPPSIGLAISQPLTQEQWEAALDPQLAFGPPGRYSVPSY